MALGSFTSFTAGTTIVASQMNANFATVTSWSNEVARLDGAAFTGACTWTNTITVGSDGTGYDVNFFGDSAGHYMLWDQSADELVLATDSKLSFHDPAGGENIVASADGHLEINAGTTLDLTAPTIDLNASTIVNVDGKALVAAQSDILTLQDSGAVGQSGYIAFKDSGGTRLGYIGYPSNDDIYIKNEDDDGDIKLQVDSGRKIWLQGAVDLDAYELTVAGSASSANLLINLAENYKVYADNDGAGSDSTRLWIDGPDGGECVIGPRTGGNSFGNIRLRGGTLQFEGSLHTTTVNSIPRMAYNAGGAATVASHQMGASAIPTIFINPVANAPTATAAGDIWFGI